MHNNDPHKTFDDGEIPLPFIPRSGVIVAGKYKLVECLGQGGMGEAWLAEQMVQRKHEHEMVPRFVLKMVPGEVQNDSVEMDKVRESYLRIVGLKHSNICTLHPLEQDDRLGYVLVMEYIPGTTLRQYLHSKPDKKLDLDETVQLLMPVAEALDYAHKKKVIHRDIKPANIMVTPEGETQIIDFGLAAQIRTSMSQVSKVRMATSGTLLYMAPEQWMGELQDARTDQYALGVVAYELLSGQVPFESHESQVLAFQVISKPVPNLENLNESTNAALAKALAKDRKDRFENCKEFVRNLKALQNSLEPTEQSGTNAIILYDDSPQQPKQTPPAATQLEHENIPEKEIDQSEILKYLSSLKADVNEVDEDGNTPLHKAAGDNNLEVVKYLLARGANIEAENEYSETPLHCASLGGSLKVVKYLVNHGANIEAKDIVGRTPLDTALEFSNMEVVQYLTDQGADVNARNAFSNTPQSISQLKHEEIPEKEIDQSEILKYLSSLKADVNEVDEDGNTPLHKAAEDNNLEVVQYLLARGANIEAENEIGETPLHSAAFSGSLEVVKYLVAQGANIEAMDECGDTPLHSALFADELEVVEYLVDHGANIEGDTSLDYAGSEETYDPWSWSYYPVVFIIVLIVRWWLMNHR